MQRRKRILFFSVTNLALLLGLLLLLLIGESSLSRYFFCPFHLLGFYCPGCGMTRALRSLLSGELWLSLTQHPLLLPSAAVLGYYDAVFGLRAFGRREGEVRALPALLLLLSLLLFFLLRNLLLFAFEIDPLGDFLGG